MLTCRQSQRTIHVLNLQPSSKVQVGKQGIHDDLFMLDCPCPKRQAYVLNFNPEGEERPKQSLDCLKAKKIYS